MQYKNSQEQSLFSPHFNESELSFHKSKKNILDTKKYHSNFKVDMRVLDSTDNSGRPDYGYGVVIYVSENRGCVIIKYDNMELPIMHNQDGMRWDKEGLKGARKVRIINI